MVASGLEQILGGVDGSDGQGAIQPSGSYADDLVENIDSFLLRHHQCRARQTDELHDYSEESTSLAYSERQMMFKGEDPTSLWLRNIHFPAITNSCCWAAIALVIRRLSYCIVMMRTIYSACVPIA